MSGAVKKVTHTLEDGTTIAHYYDATGEVLQTIITEPAPKEKTFCEQVKKEKPPIDTGSTIDIN